MFDRHDRVHALITELVATYIQHEANTDPLITVTNVTTSKDYRSATIYVTTIPDTPEKEQDALVFLKRKGGDIRQYVKSKSDLRVVPFFSFEIDRGERHRQHLDEIVRDIEEQKGS